MTDVYEALLCSRLTTDTGTILELWELNTGDFELLTAEAHKPSEIVGATTLTLVEAELLAAKLVQATAAQRRDSIPASSPSKAAGGWCERHGGYLGQRCATCALEVADSAPAKRSSC